jgi:SPP1 family predicted phage head-tail adaptor
MIGAGRRDRRITFEHAATVEDDHGGEEQTWSEYAQEWAAVLFGTGQERRDAAQEGGVQAATFICLWSPTLASVDLTYRINFDGDAWDITSKVPIGLNRELHFTATRRQS